MRATIALLAMSLAACSASAGEKAERRYEMVERSQHTNQELCEAAGEAAEAWLNDGNQAKYQEWKHKRASDCNAADIDRRLAL